MPDYDSPWKEILDGSFPAFMAFFFPEAHADIDWTRAYEGLDTDLQQIVRDAALGTRLADKLMKVWRRLYERGYVRQDVLELFRFIDWVLALPAGLEARVQAELVQLEGERQMPYITSIERMGIEKGIQQGEVIVLKRLLTRRFGPLPEWAEQRLEQASPRELEGWAERILEAQQLEDVFAPEPARRPRRGAAGSPRQRPR